MVLVSVAKVHKFLEGSVAGIKKRRDVGGF